MTFELAAAPPDALAIARKLVVERGMSIQTVQPGRVVGREAMRVLSAHWPITLELTFAEAAAGTQVTANGKIGGYGPIQRRALGKALEELRTSMEFDATAA